MTNTPEVGFVQRVQEFIINIDGLPTVQINDLVENEQGVRGWVNALDRDDVEVLLIDDGMVQPGQMFKRTGKKLTVPVGNFLLTRAISPLGVPIDGKGQLTTAAKNQVSELDKVAGGISTRDFIDRQFETGIALIDTLVPIGKGQRELLLGDARSGKTGFLINTILNQKNTGVICIYASIGKPIAQVRSLIDTLNTNGALPYTVIVAAASSDPAPLIFLAPRTAFTVAEHFQSQGKDVLVVLDDMGNHAKIHREISLLGNRPPGRESYPGDIFYQHSHLVERAGNFKKEFGGGSITALPVIELNLNDFTTFIPTNLMSMTDGHLMFKATLHAQGQDPPVDIPLSVTRVGGQTQQKVQRSLATKIKQTLAQATQLETISRFSFELPFETQLILTQRELIEELLRQAPLTNIPKELQTVMLSLPFIKYFQDKNKEFVKKYKTVLEEAFLKDPTLLAITKAVFENKTDEELFQKLEAVTPRIMQFAPPPPKPVTPVQQGGKS